MALDVKILFSWTNYCRLCLQDTGIKLPIFEGEGLNRKISLKIESCLRLVTYDGDPLPRSICHKCLFKLNQAYEFHEMAVESFERLKVHLLPLKHVPGVQQYLDRAESWRIIPNKFPCDDEVNTHLSIPPIAVPLQEPCVPQGRRLRGTKPSAQFQTTANVTVSNSIKPEASIVSPAVDVRHCDSSKRPFDSDHESENGETSKEDIDPPLQKRKRSVSDGVSTIIRSTKAGPASSKLKRKKKPGSLSSFRAVSRTTNWKCIFCDSFFLNKTGLTLHIDSCLRCSTCFKEFTSLAEKAQHEAASHIMVYVDAVKKNMRRRCSYCPARFISNIMLSMHVKYDHQTSNDSSELLASSSSNVVDGWDVRSSSSSCLYDSDRVVDGERIPADLSNKAQSNHGGDDGGSDNKKAILRSPDLEGEDMIKSASQSVVKRKGAGEYPCTKCTRIFGRKENLTVHLNKHDQLSFICPLCCGAFSASGRLHIHLKNYHGKTGLSSSYNKSKKLVSAKALHCSECREEFADENSFTWHLYKHATESATGNNDEIKKPENTVIKKEIPAPSCQDLKFTPEMFYMKCETCGLKCRTEEYYRIHTEKHVKKRKSAYPCIGCSQEFKNVEARTRHTCLGETSTNGQSCCLDCGQALFIGEDHVCDNRCPRCDKVFKSARGQRLHSIYKHNGGIPFSSEEEQNELDSERVVDVNLDVEPLCAENKPVNNMKEERIDTFKGGSGLEGTTEEICEDGDPVVLVSIPHTSGLTNELQPPLEDASVSVLSSVGKFGTSWDAPLFLEEGIVVSHKTAASSVCIGTERNSVLSNLS